MVQYWDALVRVARLRMEQIGQRTFVPSELAADNADSAVKRAINVQQRLFMARWVAHDSEIEVLREQSRQAKQEIQAYDAKIRAASSRSPSRGRNWRASRNSSTRGWSEAAPDVGQTLPCRSHGDPRRVPGADRPDGAVDDGYRGPRCATRRRSGWRKSRLNWKRPRASLLRPRPASRRLVMPWRVPKSAHR